ncbi:hypothetical protein Syun_016325 [Stephania yunnanensis]|uniref:Uncharacterized protein n=1 Tax=Stephania yunnanensis TaxID=152371 RepID=A0AAP0J4Z3_9MAGN
MADRNRDPEHLQRQRDREFQIGLPLEDEDLDYYDSSDTDLDNDDGVPDDTQIWRGGLGIEGDDGEGDDDDEYDDERYGMEPEQPEYYHGDDDHVYVPPPSIARQIEAARQEGAASALSSALCSGCGGRRDGVFCPICLDSWSTGGNHYVWPSKKRKSLFQGFRVGLEGCRSSKASCTASLGVYVNEIAFLVDMYMVSLASRNGYNEAEKILHRMNYRGEDIRKLYVSQISVADSDLQKEILSLQCENEFLKSQVPEQTQVPPVEPSTSEQAKPDHPKMEEEHQPPMPDSMHSIRESIQKHDVQLRRMEAEITWMKACLNRVCTHLEIVHPPVTQDPPVADAATKENPAIREVTPEVEMSDSQVQ